MNRKARLWTGELGPTLKLGAPIMAGMVSQMLMGIADTIMVGRLGVTPLAAASFVLILSHPPVTFGLGLLSSVAVLTSHAFGAKQPRSAGEALRNGILLATCLGLIIAAGFHLLATQLHRFGQDPEVANAAGGYLVIIGWSVLPALIAHGCKQFSEALNRPWLPNSILLGSVLLNVFFNWILIYGNLGAPALGLEGAGWATLLARLVQCAVMLAFILASPSFAGFRPGTWFAAVHWHELKAMFRIGTPVGIQHLFEVSAFAFAGLMMGWTSAEALAAHQIAITCAATTFMFALGLGMGVTIRVGQMFGARKPKRMRRIGFAGLAMAATIMAFFGIVLYLGRYPIARLFVPDPIVVELAARLFFVAALFQVVDGLQVTALAALRGLADVRVPALVAVLAYWVVAIPIAAWLGLRTSLAAAGVWIGLAIGLGAAAAMLSWRFHIKSRPQAIRLRPAVAESIQAR